MFKKVTLIFTLALSFGFFAGCSSEEDSVKEVSLSDLKYRIDNKKRLCKEFTSYKKAGALKDIKYKDNVIVKRDKYHTDSAYVSYNVDFENLSTIIVVPLESEVEYDANLNGKKTGNFMPIQIDEFFGEFPYKCGNEAKQYYNKDEYKKLVS